MEDAGFTDAEMIDRMRATNQVFELTPDQQRYLADRGVSQNVINQMESLNQETRDRLMTNRPIGTTPGTTTTPPVIGQPPSSVPQRY
jgi:hypothetical protein